MKNLLAVRSKMNKERQKIGASKELGTSPKHYKFTKTVGGNNEKVSMSSHRFSNY